MNNVEHVMQNGNEAVVVAEALAAEVAATEITATVVKKLLILPAAFDSEHPLFVGYVSN